MLSTALHYSIISMCTQLNPEIDQRINMEVYSLHAKWFK